MHMFTHIPKYVFLHQLLYELVIFRFSYDDPVDA